MYLDLVSQEQLAKHVYVFFTSTEWKAASALNHKARHQIQQCCREYRKLCYRMHLASSLPPQFQITFYYRTYVKEKVQVWQHQDRRVPPKILFIWRRTNDNNDRSAAHQFSTVTGCRVSNMNIQSGFTIAFFQSADLDPMLISTTRAHENGQTTMKINTEIRVHWNASGRSKLMRKYVFDTFRLEASSARDDELISIPHQVLPQMDLMSRDGSFQFQLEAVGPRSRHSGQHIWSVRQASLYLSHLELYRGFYIPPSSPTLAIGSVSHVKIRFSTLTRASIQESIWNVRLGLEEPTVDSSRRRSNRSRASGSSSGLERTVIDACEIQSQTQLRARDPRAAPHGSSSIDQPGFISIHWYEASSRQFLAQFEIFHTGTTTTRPGEVGRRVKHLNSCDFSPGMLDYQNIHGEEVRRPLRGSIRCTFTRSSSELESFSIVFQKLTRDQLDRFQVQLRYDSGASIVPFELEDPVVDT